MTEIFSAFSRSFFSHLNGMKQKNCSVRRNEGLFVLLFCLASCNFAECLICQHIFIHISVIRVVLNENWFWHVFITFLMSDFFSDSSIREKDVKTENSKSKNMQTCPHETITKCIEQKKRGELQNQNDKTNEMKSNQSVTGEKCNAQCYRFSIWLFWLLLIRWHP